MNRLDRVSHVLIQLQSKRLVTAREVAERFGVSIRTVYRDIRTLREAGVPVGEEEGKGYFLVDGYQLPPVMFTPAEASALVAIGKVLHYHSDKSLKTNYGSALMKIKAVMRKGTLDNLEYWENRIGTTPIALPATEHLAAFQEAIPKHAVLRIGYTSGKKKEQTSRKLRPYALYFNGFSWAAIGYCMLRNELREFRLDRIDTLRETGETFRPDPDFRLGKYLAEREQKLFPNP